MRLHAKLWKDGKVKYNIFFLFYGRGGPQNQSQSLRFETVSFTVPRGH